MTKRGSKLIRLWELGPQPKYKTAIGRGVEGADDNPWSETYEATRVIIVRAYDEEEARRYAQKEGSGTECLWLYHKDAEEDVKVWLDPEFTFCKELTKYGKLGVICHR